MAPPGSWTFSRKVASAAAVTFAVIAVGAVATVVFASQATGRFCTTAASAGTPVADTPKAAFEAWWDEAHPDGPPVGGANIRRTGEHTWKVDRVGNSWRQVEVERTPTLGTPTDEKGWAVASANRCSGVGA